MLCVLSILGVFAIATPTMANTRIRIGNSDVHVFDFFKNTEMASDINHPIQPGITQVGELSSIDDVDRLIPAAHYRIEMEKTVGEEEIRVIDDWTGEFHAAIGSAALDIIAVLDLRTDNLFERDGAALPVQLEEKNLPFWRSIIMYDLEGQRILPALRHAGMLVTEEDYEAKRSEHSITYIAEDFVGMGDRRTGNVWWAGDGLRQQLLPKWSSMFERVRKERKTGKVE